MSLWKIRFLLAGCLLGVTSAAIPAPAKHQKEVRACTAGPSLPSDSSQLRPTQTATCPYDAQELNRRLLTLLALRGSSLGIEALERALGIPLLYTSYDDPRMASYRAIVAAAPGHGEWKLQIGFSEGFWPMIDSRPVRFRGTMRPVRLNPAERGQIRLDVTWLAPREISVGSPYCLPISKLDREARRRRWRKQPLVAYFAGHGPFIRRVEFRRDDILLSSDVSDNGECVDDLEFSAEPNPPVQSITPEEEAAMRRAKAEGLEKAILARPAEGKDDENARNAEAKFYRDADLRNYLGAPDPIGARIDSLPVERLRDLLKRVVSGNAWGHAREDCEKAIEDKDPPASLLDRSRKRGLDEVELKAMQTYCSIYVHGRRFRRATPAK